MRHLRIGTRGSLLAKWQAEFVRKRLFAAAGVEAEIVQQNRGARESEIPRAELIVEEHVGKFLSWQASVELVGLVDALRSRIREERAAFIRARLESMKHLAPSDRERMEALMDELLEKLLVEPAERLRGERELRRKIQNVEALRDLFLSKKDKA